MAAAAGDPERRAAAGHLSAAIAGLLEDGSLRAARARTVQDATCLADLGREVTLLADAMVVLLRSRP